MRTEEEIMQEMEHWKPTGNRYILRKLKKELVKVRAAAKVAEEEKEEPKSKKKKK